ncbi:energy-coupling factor transporter transmembrane component T family protein [Oenococcus sicerae]|uniref:energy-coupling factor transporter transmembrane component T family protein n=1 Tax=Oenococcus sicerae TaxID=2203724 RepID=UPI0039E76029
MKAINPSLKFVFVMLISLEISFTNIITLNIYLIILGGIYLLMNRVNYKKLLWLLLMPLIPAFGSWMSFYFNGTGNYIHTAWVLFTRVYAYVWFGAALTLTTDASQLLASFEQNFHMPTKFVYGILGAFNFVPRILETIKQVKIAALMRGETLHAWSPQIFFKAVLISLRWSDNLAQAMESHGFSEKTVRTHYKKYPVSLTSILLALFIFATIQFFIFGRFA